MIETVVDLKISGSWSVKARNARTLGQKKEYLEKRVKRCLEIGNVEGINVEFLEMQCDTTANLASSADEDGFEEEVNEADSALPEDDY